MRIRKLISIFITLMVIFFSLPMVLAADEEWRSYTTQDGLSIEIPADFDFVLWYGMSSEDPVFEEIDGLEYDMVTDYYDEFGIVVNANATPADASDGQVVNLIVTAIDMPPASEDPVAQVTNMFESLMEAAPDPESIDPDEGGIFVIGYGTVNAGGHTLFKAECDILGRPQQRVIYYYLFTDSGTMYRLDLLLISDPASTEEPVPFSEEDIAYIEGLAESVAATMTYEGNIVEAEGEPFTVMNATSPATDGASTAAENADMETASPDTGNDEGGAASPSDTGNSNGRSASSSFNFFKSFTNFKFPIWLIAGAMVIMLLAGVKLSKFKEWQEEPLSLDTSKCIQGFAAVAIILHHLTQELTDKSGPLQFLSECGVLFVGIFFFFSGYGLYTSLKTKKDYLKGFLKKRLLTILIPFYMCNLVFVVATCICGIRFKGLEILAVLSGWSLINTHMWYIVEIAILYLVFFILYRLIKNRTVATVLMSLFVLGMMYFSLQLAHGDDFSCSYWFMGEWWYNSSFLFIIGIVVSKHADLFRKIARKAYWALIPVFGVLTWFLGVRTHIALMTYSYWSEIPGEDPAIGDKLRCLSVQLPWIICFVVLVLLIMMKVRFGNPVLKFLGAISLELYLLHNLFLTGLREGSVFRVPSASMYMTLTILLAIGLATVVSGVDKYLIAVVTGKKKDALALSDVPRNHFIDVMRVVMAFLVVTIHWPFDGSAGQVFITFGKTAVPFFLVVCGYFLFREDSSEMMRRLLKQTKRIFIFYVLSNLFYMGMFAAYSYKMSHSMADFKACFKTKPLMDFLLYNFSPFSEHLWFFGSLLYALLIMLLLNKLKVLKYSVYAGPLLVAGYVILSHMGVGEGYQLRNAILVGLGYTLTGMLIRKYEKKILAVPHLGIILPVLFAVCSATAVWELGHYAQGTAVPFVSCEILTVVIVLICLRFPNLGADTFAEKFGKDCTLPVYILHIAVMMLFLMTSNEKFFGNFGAVTIFVVTALIAGAYESIKNAVIKTR